MKRYRSERCASLKLSMYFVLLYLKLTAIKKILSALTGTDSASAGMELVGLKGK